MEESAEEILARLERYAASRRGRPPPSAVHRAAVPNTVDTPAASKPVAAVDTLFRAACRQVLAASSCVLAILVVVWLDHPVAVVIAAALTLVGVIGLIRRVLFAGSWAIGLVVAGLLLRFS